MTGNETVKLHKWWMSELQKITQKVVEQEEKRKVKEEKKYKELLADYESREQIIDAYGYGCITEKQLNKLLDIWDKVKENSNSQYQAKIDLLQDFYEESKEIVRRLEKEEQE